MVVRVLVTRLGIPSPLSAAHLVSILVLTLVAEFLTLSLASADLALYTLTALVTLAVWMVYFHILRGSFSFDEHGLYSKGKMILDWIDVKRVETNFFNKSFAHNIGLWGFPRTPLGLLVSVDLNRMSVVGISYAVSIVFHDRSGGVASVPADFDKLLGNGLLIKMKDLVEARNPSVEFTYQSYSDGPK